MSRIRMLISIICVSVLLLGCQATPDTPPIVYQGKDYINEDSLKNSSFLDVTDHLTCSVDMNGLLINFDSDIVIPNNIPYSFVEIEKAAFSKKEFEKYIDYFSQSDTELLKTNTLTKRQIAELLVGLEDVSPDLLPADVVDAVKDELNSLYETAPENISENDALFSFDEIKTGEYFEAFALAKDDTYCQYSGVLDGNSFSYIRNSYTIPTPQSIISEDDPEWNDFSGEFPISEDDAIDAATQVLIIWKLHMSKKHVHITI